MLFHVLFIVLLFQFDNDMTDGGAGYKTGFAFACLLNLYAFLCVANSNPGYVSEQERCPEDQEDIYREQDRIRRERIAERVKSKRERERHATEAEVVADDDDDGGDDAELPDLESGGGDRTSERRGEDEGTGGLLGAPGGASNSSDLATATSSSFVGADNSEPRWASTANTARRGRGCARSTATTAAGACASSTTTASGWERASGRRITRGSCGTSSRKPR